ncbi:RNA polymerase sigma-70 factor [Sphingobacterium sp. MYb382]|uniref:RNA polymerase sigma-70 factor n=1 Tax=Sphingobacterium sp. MYb382 TaxID=2745278 RepID=UPI0030EB8329
MLSGLNDEELFLLVKQEQDWAAFGCLYDRYWDKLWRFSLRHQIHSEEAQDTLQDVFSALWENRARIDIKTKLSSFLYRATLNQILKKVDRSKVIASYIGSISAKMQEDGLSLDELIYEKELQENLSKALEAMPSKMRLVFEASRFEGLSHEEIAVKMEISKETVKSQIKNALKVVRKYVHVMLHVYL